MTTIAAFSVEFNGTKTDVAHIAPDIQSSCSLIGLLLVLVNSLEKIQPDEVGTAESQFCYFQCSILSDSSHIYSFHISTVFEKKSLIYEINNAILSLAQRVQTDLRGDELAVKL